MERDKIIEIVRDEMRRPVRCTPQFPHEAKLRYTGGPSGEYRCECGARYRKDGKGGLMLAPEV